MDEVERSRKILNIANPQQYFQSTAKDKAAAISKGAGGGGGRSFLAQLRRFLWVRGCLSGLFRGCLRCVRGHQGVFRVYFV